MRLQGFLLNFVLNFLLGVAWGAVVFGGFLFSYSFYLNYDDISFTIMSVIIGMLPGLIAVVLIEHLITSKEKLAELKKQSLFLEKLLQEKDSKLP